MIKSGVEVNVVHHTNHALEGFNESHVNKLIQKLKDEGVKFYFSENTKSVKPNAQRFIVETESGKMIETDYVLDATGRKPNVQQIGLEKVGILFSDRGIEVDDYLRTNVKNIYASGDVINKMIPKLTLQLHLSLIISLPISLD